MNLKIIFISCLLSLCLFISPAQACFSPGNDSLVLNANLIFKGIVKKTNTVWTVFNKSEKRPNTVSNFEINDLYKGNADRNIDIYYHVSKGVSESYNKPFPPGTEMVVFAQKHHPDNFYSISYCTQAFVSKSVSQDLIDFKSEIEVLDKELAQNSSSKELYLKKLKRLEDFQDSDRMETTYKDALKNIKDDNEFLTGYANTLDKTENYNELLKLIPGLPQNDETETLKQLALINLGRANELNGKSVHISGHLLHDISIENVSLPNSDFSNVKFNEVKMNNVLLNNSVFKNSNLQGIEFSKVNASNSDFENAKINGRINESLFNNVNLKAANLRIYEFKNSDLLGANLSNSILDFQKPENLNFENAKFSGAKIRSLGNSNTKGADFTGATFFDGIFSDNGQYQNLDFSHQKLANASFATTDLSNASFANSELNNAIFSSALLKNVNFQNADLTNAKFNPMEYNRVTDLSGADFSSAKIDGIVWNGAKYDCSTKFPHGFDPKTVLMQNGDMSCGSNLLQKINYSWKGLLVPPNQHYRIMPLGSLAIFENSDLSDANFEGIRQYQPDSIITINLKPGNTESFPEHLIFRNSNLSHANFKYVRGNYEFWSSNLSNADFSYSELRARVESQVGKITDFSNSLFHCANMTEFNSKEIENANLEAAIFNSSNLSDWGSEFYKFDPIEKRILFRFMDKIINKYGPANYTDMDFNKCNVEDIDFGHTNLSGSHFKGAHFYRTDFSRANIQNVDFDGARIEDSAIFPANFDFSKYKFIPTAIVNSNSSSWAISGKGLVGNFLKLSEMGVPFEMGKAKLAIPNFPNEDLSKTDYTAAWLPNSNLSKANLDFSNFQASNLKNANLSSVSAQGTVFSNAILDNADLSNANLVGADIRGASLIGANLNNANLKNVIYDYKTIWPDDVDFKNMGTHEVIPVKPAKAK